MFQSVNIMNCVMVSFVIKLNSGLARLLINFEITSFDSLFLPNFTSSAWSSAPKLSPYFVNGLMEYSKTVLWKHFPKNSLKCRGSRKGWNSSFKVSPMVVEELLESVAKFYWNGQIINSLFLFYTNCPIGNVWDI